MGLGWREAGCARCGGPVGAARCEACRGTRTEMLRREGGYRGNLQQWAVFLLLLLTAIAAWLLSAH